MEEQWALEKLGNHKYRHHRLWDGTLEMLDVLKKEGFTDSLDYSDDYYHDFEEADDHFNFGASMSECIQILYGSQHFYQAFCLTLTFDNKDARFGKQLAEAFDSIDLLFPLIRFMRIDNFMYLIARNYNKSLGEQAKKIYQEQDEAGFITWVKGVVEPRFSGNVTLNEIRPYLIFEENLFQDINFLDAFYSNWLCVKENEKAFHNWVETNEIPMKNPGEIFNDCLLHPDDRNAKQYSGYYWFGYEPCAFLLFSMLNSQNVSIGVKVFLRNTLTYYGKKDEEFAKQLQVLYDQYRIINGGWEIDFVQQEFTNESFAFPEADVKKHLSEDIVDTDKTNFIDIVCPIYNDPEKLTRLFGFLVKSNYINKNDLDTAIYRFTGKRKPESLVEKIRWNESINDLLYIFKKFYGGEYDKIILFFEIEFEEKIKKNYSSYADRPGHHIKDLFMSLYTAQYA